MNLTPANLTPAPDYFPTRDARNVIESFLIEKEYASMKEILLNMEIGSLWNNIDILQLPTPEKKEKSGFDFIDFCLSIVAPAVLSEIGEYALKRVANKLLKRANINQQIIDNGRPALQFLKVTGVSSSICQSQSSSRPLQDTGRTGPQVPQAFTSHSSEVPLQLLSKPSQISSVHHI